jgi:hypothetical protein
MAASSGGLHCGGFVMRGISLVRAVVLGLVLILVCGLTQPLAAQEQPPARDESTERLAATEIIGQFHVYILHGYIGTTADLHYFGKLEAAPTRAVMTEMSNVCTAATKALQPVRNGKLADADRQLIDELIAILDLLQKQTQAVSDWTQTKAETDLKRYADLRTQCYAKIKKTLGIPDPPADGRSVPPPVGTPAVPPPPAPPAPTTPPPKP